MSAADDIARLRAEADQGKEGIKEFAGTVWSFYSALVKDGFASDQALAITLAWMAHLLGRAKGNGG